MIKEIIDLEAKGESFPLFLLGPGSSALDAAWSLIGQTKLPQWGSLLMESQNSGRGRMGRVWQSPPGHIYGAISLPPAPPFDGPGASLALALMLSLALENLGFKCQLKWPNDLIYKGGKTGGILLESKPGHLVAGIGLNLGAPPLGDWPQERDPGTPPPIALPFEGPPVHLWSDLVKNIIIMYNEKFGGRPMAELILLAEEHLLWRGQTVTAIKPASDPPAPAQGLTGRIIGLGAEGYLRLAGPDGEYRLWSGSLGLANHSGKIS